MSQTARIRFVLAGGNVDFYTDEIIDHKLSNVKDFQLQENQTNSPYIYYVGDANKILEITFNEFYETTRAKIDQLIDEQKEITIYYEYNYDNSNMLNMILYNKNNIRRTKIYYFGERAAKVIHKLTFLQSS